MHPVPVHAEGTEHDVAVVAPEVTVDGQQPFGTQFEEHGVDKLHHVVAAQPGQQQSNAQGQPHSVEGAAAVAADVDVARIVLPEVAVADDGHLVSKLAQSLGQRPVYVAVLAKQ